MSRYPSPIFNGDLKKVVRQQEKHYNAFSTSNKNISKISITTLILCLLICIAIISTIIWYSVAEAKNGASIISENQDESNLLKNNDVHAEKFFNFDFDEKNELDSTDVLDKSTSLNSHKKGILDLDIIEEISQNNNDSLLSEVNINENSEIGENEHENLNLINILDTLSSIALGSKKADKNESVSNKNDEVKSNNENLSNLNKLNVPNITSLKVQIANEKKVQIDSNDSAEKSLFHTLKNQSEQIGNSALNYLNGIISVSDLFHNSSYNNSKKVPNDSNEDIRNDSSNMTSKEIFDRLRNESIKINMNLKGLGLFSDNKNETSNYINKTYNAIFQKFLKILKNNFGKYEENYYDQDYFYSETDAQHFYYDYERITWSNYLLEKIQELYDWIVSDLKIYNGTVIKGNDYAPLPQILRALNYSILEGDASILLFKLKEVLFINNNTDFDSQWNKKMLTNTSSVLSFGLLALDVLLLRNIQLIAWDNQEVANREVMKDPEVFAFNALFMDPSKVKQMQDVFKESANGSLEENNFIRKSFYGNTYGEDLTSSFYKNTNFGEELVKFVVSTIRAITNLGYAFKNSRGQVEISNSLTRSAYDTLMKHYNDMRLNKNNLKSDIKTPSEIDCLWTLYCKNLEKATNLEGVYGFLAKINGIGLRLILGELSLEEAFEALVTDTLIGLNHFQCKKLFSKCDEKLAPKMILQKIITRA